MPPRKGHSSFWRAEREPTNERSHAKKRSVPLLGLICLLLLLTQGTQAESPTKLPEFPELEAKHWINSKPLTVADLRDSVVLVKVWTFG